MNPTIIAINGILQAPSAFMEQDTSIIFHQAPNAGDNVQILIKDKQLSFTGNGTNCVFTMPSDLREELRFKQFMHDAWLNKDNPTVKDSLEKLRVVMELVR